MAFALPVSAQIADKQEVEYNQYGQQVVSTPVKAALQDGILVFQAKKMDYKMWFDVRVQGDAAVYFGEDKNLVSIGNGMILRRTRFAIKAQIDKNWYGEFDTDWTSGTPEIKDAILEYTGIRNMSIRVGNFKEIFSIQRNTTSRYLQFMERPMVTALAPSRHIGLNIEYNLPYLWLSAGAFGPELEGEEAMTAIQDGNKDLGLSEGMSYTAKAVYRPLYKKQNSSLHIGAAFSYREPKLSSTDGYNAIRYSSRNSTSINRKKFLDTDAIKGLDHEIAYTFELAGHHKGLRYEAAYISRQPFLNPDKAEIPAGEKLMPANGWYVQAGYLLFGGSQNYDAGGAKYTRINPGREWGDLELCARFETADFNISKYYAGGSAQAFSIGINFYPTRNVKFVINYQYNMNDKYANGKGATDGTDKGKFFTGYDNTGKKTTVPSQIDGLGGINYSMLACRFQVAF